MATADEYAKWIVDNSNKKGTADFDTVAAMRFVRDTALTSDASAAAAAAAPTSIS